MMRKVSVDEIRERRAAEQARRERRERLEAEIRDTMPPQSVPGIADRLRKVEELLGLREPDA